jgi:hypothetical protein
LAPRITRGPTALLNGIAANNSVAGIYFGNLSALRGALQDRRSFSQAAVALAVDGVTVLMNLKKH